MCLCCRGLYGCHGDDTGSATFLSWLSKSVCKNGILLDGPSFGNSLHLHLILPQLLEFTEPTDLAKCADSAVPTDPAAPVERGGFPASRTVLLLAELCCDGVASGSGGKLKETSSCYQDLLLLVLSCVEVWLKMEPSSLLNKHPHLLSALALLLNLDPSASYLPRKRYESQSDSLTVTLAVFAVLPW